MDLTSLKCFYTVEENAPPLVTLVVRVGPMSFAFRVPMALAREAYGNLGGVLRRAEQEERKGVGGVGRPTET